jgi:acetyltransferase-like isoleucine patch superfamily enzyme
MRGVLVPRSDVNSDTAMIAEWTVADRSRVTAGMAIAQVETSKAILDVAAPEDGYLLHAAEQGAEVHLAEPIAYLFAEVAELIAHIAHGDLAHTGDRPADANGQPRATVPAARRAGELGIDLGALRRPGLITVRDVEEAAAASSSGLAELPDPLPGRPGARRLMLVGAGLGATQVLEIVRAGDGSQDAVAIVDDDRALWGGAVGEVPVVGGSAELERLFTRGTYDAAVITISTSVAVRARLRDLCRAGGIPLSNAIDPTARIPADVVLGDGNVICAFCHLGAGARIGDNNFLSAYNSFDHHNELGSDISTGPGCMASGLVRIEDRVRMGTGVFIEPHVTVGAGALIASGAVLRSSVPAGHAVKTRVVTTAVVPVGR